MGKTERGVCEEEKNEGPSRVPRSDGKSYCSTCSTELLKSPERAFMATSAAICLAPFLLLETTAGNTQSPTFTQYLNLEKRHTAMQNVLRRRIPAQQLPCLSAQMRNCLQGSKLGFFLSLPPPLAMTEPHPHHLPLVPLHNCLPLGYYLQPKPSLEQVHFRAFPRQATPQHGDRKGYRQRWRQRWLRS